MLSGDDFNLLDPRLKDEAWAKRIVTYLIMNRNNLTLGKNVVELREWQNSNYDLTPFKQPYRHLLSKEQGGDLTPEDAAKCIKIDFTPLALFEVTRNILAGEIDKDEIHIDADCSDPTIQSEKEKEFELLKNKKAIQDTVNKLYQGIGIPSDFQVGKQGGGEFNSNMDQFDALGLNADRPEDREFFASTFYRPKLEIVAGHVINTFNNQNELQEIQKLHIDDVITFKALAMQTVYNTSTGLPTIKYLYPDHVYFTGSPIRRDFKDALAIGWEQNMTISDFLKMVGDEDFSKQDYNDLLLCVGGGTSSSYPNGIDFTRAPQAPDGFCTWTQYFQFNIRVGYQEWKTTDRNEMGRYYQKTMKSFYVSNVSYPYKLYKYGYLNVQAREGTEDQLSCFSINAYRIPGKSLIEICIPYFKVIFSNWLKYQWFLATAKPSGYAFDLDSLRNVAIEILNGTGSYNDMLAVIEMFKRSPDMFYKLRSDEDSEMKLGGDGLPYQVKTNGLDPTAMDFLKSIEWLKQQIQDETGLNNARNAQSPSPEEAYKKTQLVFNQSENATEYIMSSLSNVYAGSGYRTFAIVQTIIIFDLPGVDNLKQIFGKEYMDIVRMMKKTPIQYFDITIKRFIREREREEIRDYTKMAIAKGEIPDEIGLIINDIDDYKKAASVLSFYREKTKKEQQQIAAQAQQNQMELEKLQHQNKMEQINATNQGLLAKEQMNVDGLIKVAQIQVQGKIDQQAERLNQQPLLNQQKSNLKKEQDTHNAGLELTQQIFEGNKANAPTVQE